MRLTASQFVLPSFLSIQTRLKTVDQAEHILFIPRFVFSAVDLDYAVVRLECQNQLATLSLHQADDECKASSLLKCFQDLDFLVLQCFFLAGSLLLSFVKQR